MIARSFKTALGSVLVASLLAQGALAQQGSAVAPDAGAAQGAPTRIAEHEPIDDIERGFIQRMDENEKRLKTSQFVIRDPDLNGYVREVLCRAVGQAECADVRIYLLRTSQFNATMAPNGAMEVWSGLLLRARNEAQLAAVLAHEYTHYRNHHSIKLYRDARSKSAAAVWLAFTGIGLLASISMMASFSQYSREMEQEADLGGLTYMANAGYDTREAARIWEQLREEMDATALARGKKSRKDKTGGLYASHPPSAERVAYLTSGAAENPGVPGETGAARYRTAMAHFWPEFVDDQLKQNDTGASDYLLGALAVDGWTPELLYARGELYRRRGTDADLEAAAGYYREAIAGGASIAETWRGLGLSLMKLGHMDEGQAALRTYLERAPGASDAAMIAMMAGEQQ